jgi:hypothetical protein
MYEPMLSVYLLYTAIQHDNSSVCLPNIDDVFNLTKEYLSTGTCGNPNHDHTFTIGRPWAWPDKLSFLYLSPTSDISSDILLKTNLQTFLSEVTTGNKTSDGTSDIWPLIPWRTLEYSSDFLFLSLFRQKNLREFFRHFFRHIIYKPC